MKKKRILFVVPPVLLTAVLLVMLQEFTLKRYVIVHALMDEVALLFTGLEKWKSWHPDFATTTSITVHKNSLREQSITLPGITYVVKVLHPAAIVISRTEQGKTTTASLSATAYRDGSYTYVEYTEAMSGFRWLRQQFSHHDKAALLLKELQLLAEDDSRRYGFPIQTVAVTDTLILTTRMKVASDSVLNSIPVLYKRLQLYCRQQNIPAVKDYYYTSIIYQAGNQAELAVGIPVEKVTAGQHPGFEFLRLPANGKLVAGTFTGRHDGLVQLYSAMDKYMLNKRLRKVAQPLEQYHIADTSFGAGSIVAVRVFYPVF